MTKEELEKEAEEFTDSKKSFWRQGRTCIDSVRQANIASAEPREKRIADLEQKNKDLADCNSRLLSQTAAVTKRVIQLEKENEQEKKLNAEIKARFVKCNTCTPDMKEKCLMFNESLCEGERCEELVDLMALVDKRDFDDKLTKATELLNEFMRISKASDEDFEHDYSELIRETEQFIKEIEK